MLGSLTLLAAVAFPRYRVEALEFPKKYSTFNVSSLNNHGDVVGSVTDQFSKEGEASSVSGAIQAYSESHWEHACIWKKGKLHLLFGWRNPRWSRAVDINDRGDVLGHTLNGFVISDNKLRNFGLFQWSEPDPDAKTNPYRNLVVGINNSGSVAGYVYVDRGGNPVMDMAIMTANDPSRPFYWKGGKLIPLMDPAAQIDYTVRASCINDNGDIAGEFATSIDYGDDTSQVYLWSNGKTILERMPAPNDESGEKVSYSMAYAKAINSKADVLGSVVRNNDNHTCAVIWRHEVPEVLGDFNPIGMAESGLILGIDRDGAPMLWQHGKSAHLQGLVTGTGWTIKHVHGINDQGQVIAEAFKGRETDVNLRPVLLSPIVGS